MATMRVPAIPEAVAWRNGMVLEPSHFEQTDRRASALAHLAAAAADPWPWGFVQVAVDPTALASAQLRVDCEGFFPDGTPFRQNGLTRPLPQGREAQRLDYQVLATPDGDVGLAAGSDAPAEKCLPVARLTFQGGVWTELSDWSPPAYLVGAGHPLREDMARQLGALAALATGFMATLRLPGAEDRPTSRAVTLVATTLVQGVGVTEALLAAPFVSPGRLGIEALRLALGVRVAAGVAEPLDERWDPADQRGSMRRLLYAAESAAASVGVPFRTNLFRPAGSGDLLLVNGMPPEGLLLVVEASQPANLISARTWLEGAALAAPDRIQEAFNRRVAGCPRHAIERDPRTGVASGPLLALYRVENDLAWRGNSDALALGAKTPPPTDASFSIYLPHEPGVETGTTSRRGDARRAGLRSPDRIR